MVRKHTFPRVNRGDSIYRVEWKKEQPLLVQYTVQASAASSMAVIDTSGKEQLLIGKEILKQFAKTPEEAVYREFENIAEKALKHGIDRRLALVRCAAIAALLRKESR